MHIVSRLMAASILAFAPLLASSVSQSAHAMGSDVVSSSCKGLHPVTSFMASAEKSRYVWEKALERLSKSNNDFARTQSSIFLDGWQEGETLVLTSAECIGVEQSKYRVHIKFKLNKIGEVGISFLVSGEDVTVTSLFVYSATVVIP